MSDVEFEAFPKIPRWKREILISEKIDGSNGQIYVPEDPTEPLLAGSRNRWVTTDKDNYGFAAWVKHNEDELRTLGPGRHYGEWYGIGVNRGYGLFQRRFALFNTSRWKDGVRPPCCDVVPLLYAGVMNEPAIDMVMDGLRTLGSVLAPGYMNPEGIVIFHCASRTMFKRTLEHDNVAKTAV